MLGHVEAALARRAASEDRLRRFAADASHELRTPLAAIRGYAELARRHPGPVPPDIAHALGRVESESTRSRPSTMPGSASRRWPPWASGWPAPRPCRTP